MKTSESKQGMFIVSLDFELFWGMQDCVPLEQYADHVLGGRQAIQRLLVLFQQYGIHATWATVGFQFAQSIDQLQSYLPGEKLRPAYNNAEVSTYGCLEQLRGDEKDQPCFLAASLLKSIAAVPGQEIGSHTFSHYYCREAGQTPEQFSADMKAALRIAADSGYTLTSVVFPRNQTDKAYVDVLRSLGFTAYRDLENDWIHRLNNRTLRRGFTLLDMYLPFTGFGGCTPRNEDGIVNLMGSRMYRPFFPVLGWLEWLKLLRIKGEMLHAARNGRCYHLWWHPHNIGVKTEYHIHQLEQLFSWYQKLQHKYGMRSLNMAEASSEIRKQS